MLAWRAYLQRQILHETVCGNVGNTVVAVERSDSLIRSYRGRWPVIASSAYIDPAATIIGDVTIGEQSSVWPGAVIRGDVHWIRIGARSNVQDVSTLHVMKDELPADARRQRDRRPRRDSAWLHH